VEYWKVLGSESRESLKPKYGKAFRVEGICQAKLPVELSID